MPQATNLAAAQTAATGSDITVTTTPVTVALVTSSSTARIPLQATFGVFLVQGALEQPIGGLSAGMPTMVLSAPGVYRVKRGDISAFGVNVGVTTDT